MPQTKPQLTYPVDLRISGRDLVKNHLTFWMYNHTAIFLEAMRPKAVRTSRVKPRAKELRVGRGAWRRQLLRALYTRDIVPLRRGHSVRRHAWVAGAHVDSRA